MFLLVAHNAVAPTKKRQSDPFKSGIDLTVRNVMKLETAYKAVSNIFKIL